MESLHNSNESNSNAADLNLLLKNKWDELALGFGAIVMFWAYIVGPFHSATSKKSTVRETVETIELTRKKFELVRDSDSPFLELHAFGITNEVSLEAEQAISISYEHWNGASEDLRNKINQVIHNGNASSFKKLIKDTVSFNDEILPSNALYIFNNRSQESSFATLKSNDKKFLSMMRERLSDTAVCQINKTSEWLRTLPKKFVSDIIGEAKSERKSMSLKRRKSMETARTERLKKLSRIAPASSNNFSSDESEIEEF